MSTIRVCCVAIVVLLAITLAAPRATLGFNDDGYRMWDRANGDYILFSRKLVGVEGSGTSTKVQLKREQDGGIDTFELSEFAPEEIRLIRLWQDPQKRKGVELALDGGFVSVAEDNTIELSLNSGKATDEDLTTVVRSLPDITSLLLGNSAITQEGLKSLVELKQLRKLKMPLFLGERPAGVVDIEVDRSGRRGKAGAEENRRVVDPGFHIIAQIQSLEELDFQSNGSVSFGKYFDDLAKSQLKRLRLDNARLSAQDLQRIAKIQTLEFLEPGIGPLFPGIKPPVLQYLRGMKQLRGINLDFARLTDGDAEHLRELPNLRELHCFGWTHKGFEALGKCEQFEILRVLDGFDEQTDNADLTQIGKLKKLTTLWISSSKVTDDGLAHLADLVELKELDLPESITPKGLRHLEKLKKLQRLGFSDIDEDEISEQVCFSHALDLLVEKQGREPAEALRVLGQNWKARFRGYVSLNQRTPKLDLRAMQQYAEHFQQLERLALNEESLDDWLVAVKPLQRMRHFTIEGTRDDSQDTLKRVPVKRTQLTQLAKWNHLEVLVLNRCDLADNALQAIADLPQLESLEMIDCGLTPGNLKGIGALRSLKQLSITGSEIPPEELAQLGTLASLEELTLSVSITPQTLAQWKGLKSLQKLEFRRTGSSLAEILNVLTNDWGRSRRDAAKMILSVEREDSDGNVLTLEFDEVLHGPLDARGDLRNGEFRIQDEDLAVVTEFPELQSLTLPSGMGDAALSHLAGLKKLRELRLQGLSQEGTKLTDAGARHLEPLADLEIVDLGESELTPAGVESLGRLAALRDLRMKKTRLTDGGVAALAGLEKLEVLRANGRDLTSQGLERLSKLPKLRKVDLGALERNELETIRQAYPRIGFNGLIPVDRSVQ